MTRALVPFLALVVALTGQPGLAQGNRQLDNVRLNYDTGNYADALRLARDALASQNFPDDVRVEFNRFAALSAFAQGDVKAAEEHFLRMLQINPDYPLDPFATPPRAVKLYADVREKNKDALNLVRQQLALREEQARREAQEREKKRLEDEERRRRLEEAARKASVRTIEKRSFVINFVPFGAGQLQQRRMGMGIFLASAEGALAATSIVAYLAADTIEASNRQELSLDDRIGRPPSLFVPTTTPAARTWKAIKLWSAVGFYLLYSFGVIEALVRHEDEVVTTTEVPITPGPPAPGPRPTLGTRVLPLIFPVPGGVGAGVGIGF